MVLGTWPTPSATLLPRKRTANQFPGDPHTARVKKVLVISSESEDVHMNCPHVRSEIFAPRADERGIRRADERALRIPQVHKAGMLASYSGKASNASSPALPIIMEKR